MYKMHHPKADIDRLYVKGKEGGRGMVQVEVAYKTEIINIAEYLNTKYKGDQFVNIVKNHESIQPNMSSTVKLATKFTEDLNQLNQQNDVQKNEIQHTKAKLGEVLKKQWKKNKAMHGQYIQSIDRQLISEEDTFLWLTKGDVKAKTESEIVAAQDQALQTKYYTMKYFFSV
jgi:hypothetical protein